MTQPPNAYDTARVWVLHELAQSALRKTLDALDEVGVPAIAVKGVVLAHTLYSDVGERPISDVDIRVRPRDLRSVEAVARRREWPIDRSSRQLGAVGLHVGSMLVDVETSVGPPGLCSLSVEQMLERSRPRRLPSGVICREPELYDHAMHLVVNAYKDKITQCPPWSLGDLVRMSELPEFDVGLFVQRMRESDSQTVGWIVADWLAREASASKWRSIRDAIGTNAPRRYFAAAYGHLARRAPESLAMRLLCRVGADSMGNRVKALAATILGSAMSAARPSRKDD